MIIRLRDEVGLTWAQISEGTGIPESTLQARYARTTRATGQLPDQLDGEPVQEPPWDQLARMYQAGAITLTDIAVDLAMDVRTVRRHLQRHGAEMTGAHQPLTLTMSDNELRSRHAAGETYKELAERCGTSMAHIWRRVNFHKITD